MRCDFHLSMEFPLSALKGPHCQPHRIILYKTRVKALIVQVPKFTVLKILKNSSTPGIVRNQPKLNEWSAMNPSSKGEERETGELATSSKMVFSLYCHKEQLSQEEHVTSLNTSSGGCDPK